MVAVAVLAAGCSAPAGGGAVQVYAAASLRDVLSELAPICERQIGAPLLFNFGASSDLARQIRAAGRADLFLSADEAWMDEVEEAGLLEEGSRRPLLSNRLAVVALADSGLTVRSAADLARPEIGRISLALPEAVPAGKYARQWLENAGVWAEVRQRVIPAVDVRAALAAVESGAVEVGVVYRTDARISSKIRVLHEVPQIEGFRISYPVAVIHDSPRAAAASRLEACLASLQARSVFERHGFLVLSASSGEDP